MQASASLRYNLDDEDVPRTQNKKPRQTTNGDLKQLHLESVQRRQRAPPAPQPAARLDLKALAGAREQRERQVGPPAPAPANAGASPPRPAPAANAGAAPANDEQWVTTAACSRVSIMRGGNSPIVAFENFGGDRGLRLSRLAQIEQTIKDNRAEARTNNYDTRRAIDMASRPGPAIAMQRAANRLMELASQELRRTGAAAGDASLQRRTNWKGTATLIYPAGATLGRHTDGCGNWVVLFSFGRTVRFHCGGQDEELESGDAILFNGGTGHGVVHGIDKVFDSATFHNARTDRNDPAPLPREMAYMEPYRVSVQVRQEDPPASWGWPAPRAAPA